MQTCGGGEVALDQVGIAVELRPEGGSPFAVSQPPGVGPGALVEDLLALRIRSEPASVSRTAPWPRQFSTSAALFRHGLGRA